MNNQVNDITSNSNNSKANKSTIPWLKNNNYNKLNERTLTNQNIALQNKYLPLREKIFKQFLINSALQLPEESQRIEVLNKIPGIMASIGQQRETPRKIRTYLLPKGGITKKRSTKRSIQVA